MAGDFSTLTWGAAATKVARVANGHDDEDQLLIAKEHIGDVLREWNARRRWKCLLTQASNITVIAGTSSYALPAAYKKPYAVYLVTAKKWLVPIDERHYVRGGGPFLERNVPAGYFLSNAGYTGNITIVPPPASGDVMVVWYYRKMAESGATDATTLDIPADYEGFVLDGARARMIADKGPIEKLGFWTAQAREGYRLAVADDDAQPDMDVGFSLEPTYFCKFEADYGSS